MGNDNDGECCPDCGKMMCPTNSEMRIIAECKKCNTELALCPGNWIWEEGYWICPNCEATYITSMGI